MTEVLQHLLTECAGQQLTLSQTQCLGAQAARFCRYSVKRILQSDEGPFKPLAWSKFELRQKRLVSIPDFPLQARCLSYRITDKRFQRVGHATQCAHDNNRTEAL